MATSRSPICCSRGVGSTLPPFFSRERYDAHAVEAHADFPVVETEVVVPRADQWRRVRIGQHFDSVDPPAHETAIGSLHLEMVALARHDGSFTRVVGRRVYGDLFPIGRVLVDS